MGKKQTWTKIIQNLKKVQGLINKTTTSGGVPHTGQNKRVRALLKQKKRLEERLQKALAVAQTCGSPILLTSHDAPPVLQASKDNPRGSPISLLSPRTTADVSDEIFVKGLSDYWFDSPSDDADAMQVENPLGFPVAACSHLAIGYCSACMNLLAKSYGSAYAKPPVNKYSTS